MAQPARRQASGASHTVTRNTVIALPATKAATSAAATPSIAHPRAPIASAVVAAYSRLGARVARTLVPKRRIEAADIQYESGGFSRKG
ncbi:MAG TPA: hypothetical protein VGN43_15900 [Steroidobacteraceae bacterium]|nr:hypothetical protein [Steroidobacteraceae bacterium]